MRALKVIKKNNVLKKERLVTELKLMEFLDHPNILRLFETFEDDINLYMVLEYELNLIKDSSREEMCLIKFWSKDKYVGMILFDCSAK